MYLYFLKYVLYEIFLKYYLLNIFYLYFIQQTTRASHFYNVRTNDTIMFL